MKKRVLLNWILGLALIVFVYAVCWLVGCAVMTIVMGAL